MNQDRVKEILLNVEECPKPFTLVFSGKTNKKVNGLYKPATAEIIIHNKNFESDNQLVYTALHEYAHHLVSCKNGGILQGRPHTQEFWATFHRLVDEAEEKGLYQNVFDTDPEFVELTKTIKERCIRQNGEIMLEFGRLLSKAAELCRAKQARFEDYIERVLGVPKATATSAIVSQGAGLDPSLGWDGLRFVAGIRDASERTKAIEALQSGASPSSVKGMLRTQEISEDPADRLLKEKSRIEASIRNLTARLEEIEEKLAEL